MNTDPIADLLTRIRNAQMARHERVRAPHSHIKEKIARLLQEEGFLGEVSVEGDIKKTLTLTLKYVNRKPVIENLQRISTPGLRRYVKASDLRPVLSGLGIDVVSTSRGLMVDRVARQAGLGGEWICRIW